MDGFGGSKGVKATVGVATVGGCVPFTAMFSTGSVPLAVRASYNLSGTVLSGLVYAPAWREKAFTSYGERAFF